MNTKGDRAPIDITLNVSAPADAVWNALTTAEGLTSWFPLEAKVKPGAGGNIFSSWQNEFRFNMPITVWEPNKHIQWKWAESDEPGAPAPSVVDFYLEPKGENETVIRLVHHGFADSADWDQMYDATRRGWDFEFNSLKTYLDHHLGKPRSVAHARAIINDRTPAQAWNTLVAPGKLFGKGSLDNLEPGDPFDLTFRGGRRITGTVRAAEPGRYMRFDIESPSRATMRIDIEPCGPDGADMIWIWLSTWGADTTLTDELNEQWPAVLSECFGNAFAIGQPAQPAP